VTGRILLADERRGVLVQTGEGLLWLTETESAPDAKALRVGQKLGCDPAEEIRILRKRVAELENRLAERDLPSGQKR
jgi:hypothetical protein